MNDRLIAVPAMGIVCALGGNKEDVLRGLLAGDQEGMRRTRKLIRGKTTFVGAVDVPLPDIPDDSVHYRCLNNQLIMSAYDQIRADVERAKSSYGPGRIGVVLGTSTSGIAEAERAIAHRQRYGKLPPGYHYKQQEIGAAAEFLADLAGLPGIAYTISSACASSAKAFAAAKRLLHAGLVDACIVGGSDSLCGLTLNGFDSLDSISEGVCNPFSRNRDGISIGEGAALFLLRKGAGGIQLLGTGESSDAYHISAPHPEGVGAETAMRDALAEAGLNAEDVGYVNLHGTATPMNDLMEGKAIGRVFGQSVVCSSTKPLVGHALGAAAALEVGFSWLVLSPLNPAGRLPPHRWDGAPDEAVFPLALVGGDERLGAPVVMSNSFAFGGSNASVILGRGR